MAQSAEEWSKFAFYEKVADDENAVPELCVLFARKANWLRILVGRQAKGFQAHEIVRCTIILDFIVHCIY
jgi:hypothetical protein